MRIMWQIAGRITAGCSDKLKQKTGDFLHCGKSPVFVILGHADTEMTEHSLHVQEFIRQSAIQLFSEAFSA